MARSTSIRTVIEARTGYSRNRMTFVSGIRQISLGAIWIALAGQPPKDRPKHDVGLVQLLLARSMPMASISPAPSCRSPAVWQQKERRQSPRAAGAVPRRSGQVADRFNASSKALKRTISRWRPGQRSARRRASGPPRGGPRRCRSRPSGSKARPQSRATALQHRLHRKSR